MRSFRERTERIVWIEWEDSAARSGWQRWIPDDGLLCTSIGFLVEEREHSVVISTSVMHDDEEHPASCMDPLEIPKRAIVRMLDVYWT